jgi:hypothetical protein
VGGTDVGSGESCPPRIIPDFAKVSEYSIHSPNKEPWDVLHEDVSGSYLAYESVELTPQAGS